MEPIFTYTLVKGNKWSGVISRGKLIRFTTLGKGANVALLMYNARNVTEKYYPGGSTLHQGTVYLTKGHSLLSDEYFVMASMVEDSVGWHDTISGVTTREQTDAKYGKTTYQQHRNDWLRSGYENFAIELARHGMTAKHIISPINLFSKVYQDEAGTLQFVSDHAPQDATVTLRTEMDILLVVSNTPNPLDPSPQSPSVPVRLEVFKAPPVDMSSDECVNFSPHIKRAFELTYLSYQLMAR